MPEEVQVTVTESLPDSPSSPVSSPQILPPEAIIQAAIQTGESSATAQQAATEAKETLSEAEAFLVQTREILRSELAPILTRLEALETPPEPIIQDEEEDTDEIVSANAVEIDEPAPLTPQDQPQTPAPEPARGGLVRRIFLNQ
jgi:hypothetical protein